MKSQKGAMIITLALMLPLFVSLLTFYLSLTSTLLLASESLHLCRQQVLSMQNQQQIFLKKLLALNPKAEALRTQRKIANRALKLALKSRNPKAIAAAKAYVLLIKNQQQALHSLQLTLLRQAENLATQQARNHQRNIQEKQFVSEKPKIHGKLQLAVKRTHPQSDSPSYIPRKRFSEKQSYGLKWTLQPLTPLSPFTLSCFATLSQEKNQWIAHLSAGKSSPNFYSY